MAQQKFCGFPEIGQYRNIVKTVVDRSKYVGKDENGDAIFDYTRKAPTISFSGTCKLHGTNSGVSFNQEGEMWAQSREHIITPEHDNVGLAFFAESNKETFKQLASLIPFNGYDYVTLFGEWCGGNIQKGVAINGLPKMFVIFDIKRSYSDETAGVSKYAPIYEIKLLRSPENRIYNIYDFKTYEIDIDFENPGLSQNKLAEITAEIESECPVGKAFGNIGTGEGCVWSFYDEDGNKIRFKVKGTKHSSSHVRTLAPVDTEKLESINDFVEYAVTEERLNQGLEKIYGIGGSIDITKMGDFIRWVVNDIMKEELDTMAANGLEPKNVNSNISKVCRNWLMAKINSTF